MLFKLLFAGLMILAVPLFAGGPTDSDNDGFSDVYERAVGTDPFLAVSSPTLADDPDLIYSWWPMSSNLRERLGTGLDAELRNGALLQKNGLLCDGGGAYARVRSDHQLDLEGAFSVSFWVKPSPKSCGLQKLIGRFSQKGDNRSWAIFYGGDDRLWIFISDDGTANLRQSDTAVTWCRVRRDGQWQNIGISYGVQSGLICTVDGKTRMLLHVSNSHISSIYKANADLTFGAYDVKTIGRGKEQVSNPLSGYISQIFFSKAALSVQELRELYLLGRGGDLIAYWNRDVDLDGLPDRWERDMFGDLSQGLDDDSDGDGLSNMYEFGCETDPLVLDTDGDGLGDGWEYNNNLDPLDPTDAAKDSDGDGLTNLLECQHSTNPQCADTDGDGFSDYVEYINHTSPISALDFPAESIKQWVNVSGSTLNEMLADNSHPVLDAQGNAYIVGGTYGSFGGQNNAGLQDIFLSKYSAAGVRLWTRFLGSSGIETNAVVALDSTGSVYVAGLTTGALNGQSKIGGYDAFLVKCTSAGKIEWTKVFGSSANESSVYISVDAQNKITVAGRTAGAFDGQSSSGGLDLFACQFDATGAKLWTRIVGATGDDVISGLASGSVFLLGYTTGSIAGNTNSGGTDAFLIKYASDGTKQWALEWGSAGADNTSGLVVDQAGSVYVVGSAAGSVAGAPYAGGTDAYLTKINPDGSIVWIRQVGSAADEGSVKVALDEQGNVYVACSTQGSVDGLPATGGTDLYLVKYAPDGTRQWSREWGSTLDDTITTLAVDVFGNAYVAGTSAGTIAGQTGSGGADIFVSKYSSQGSEEWTQFYGSSATEAGGYLALDYASKNITVLGVTSGSFDAQTGSGGTDVFITRVKYEEPPQVDTANGATRLSPVSATLNGNLVSDGGLPATVVIVWGTTDRGTDYALWENHTNLGVKSVGGISLELNNLDWLTKYYYRIYAVNADGEAWSPVTAEFTIPRAYGNGLVLWNKLGSVEEVEHSEYGPDGLMLLGDFLNDGKHGGCLNLDLFDAGGVKFPNEIVNPSEGCIELWVRFAGIPTNLVNGACPYLFLVSGAGYQMGFNANDGAGNGGVCGNISTYYTGSGAYGGYSYDALLGGVGEGVKWHHYALVWKDAGIAGISDGTKKLAVYVDGVMRSTRWSKKSWALPSYPPIDNGVFEFLWEQTLAMGEGHFDNIKVWDYAKTNFSDRLTEDISSAINLEVNRIFVSRAYDHEAAITIDLASTGLLSDRAKVYMCYGATDGGTLKADWDKVVDLGSFGHSVKNTVISGLNEDTAYICRFLVVNDLGVELWTSAPQTFMTTSVDRDNDGYSDVYEEEVGTDQNDPAAHPLSSIILTIPEDKVLVAGRSTDPAFTGFATAISDCLIDPVVACSDSTTLDPYRLILSEDFRDGEVHSGDWRSSLGGLYMWELLPDIYESAYISHTFDHDANPATAEIPVQGVVRVMDWDDHFQSSNTVTVATNLPYIIHASGSMKVSFAGIVELSSYLSCTPEIYVSVVNVTDNRTLLPPAELAVSDYDGERDLYLWKNYSLTVPVTEADAGNRIEVRFTAVKPSSTIAWFEIAAVDLKVCKPEGYETEVISRTWTADDPAGNHVSGIQTISLFEDDLDNDGLPDEWEMQYFGDLSKTASSDSDGDGLADVEEYQNGANPLASDSDADGMPDKWELENGFDPVDAADSGADSDADGLTNSAEFLLGSDPKKLTNTGFVDFKVITPFRK